MNTKETIKGTVCLVHAIVTNITQQFLAYVARSTIRNKSEACGCTFAGILNQRRPGWGERPSARSWTSTKAAQNTSKHHLYNFNNQKNKWLTIPAKSWRGTWRKQLKDEFTCCCCLGIWRSSTFPIKNVPWCRIGQATANPLHFVAGTMNDTPDSDLTREMGASRVKAAGVQITHVSPRWLLSLVEELWD